MPQNQNIYFFFNAETLLSPCSPPSLKWAKEPLSRTVALNLPLWDEFKPFVAKEHSPAAFQLPPDPSGRDSISVGEDPKPTLVIGGTQSPLERGVQDHLLLCQNSVGPGTRSAIYNLWAGYKQGEIYLVSLSLALHTSNTKYIGVATQCHFCN